MMINKKLINEVPQAKPYIIKHVVMQWLSLLCSVGIIFLIADLITKASINNLTHRVILVEFMSMFCLLGLKVWFTKLISIYSFKASKGVKDLLRQRIYAKLMRLKQSYQKDFSTSEIVQLSIEGIDQLETYFGKYLPQFFYSMLAPLTLFLILVWIDVSSAFVLLLCVPLIPISIIAIQKFAKKLLAKYWKSYTTLGDSFLENLQGLTTLKIYQVDDIKQAEMNKEAEHFRRITMKVLTMQLNSVSMMDIVAYGGTALGSAIASLHFLDGSLSLAGAICIVLLSAEFFLPLRLLGSYFHIAMNGMAASDSIYRLLELPEDTTEKKKITSFSKPIRFENMQFQYDEHRCVLQDINIVLQPNTFLAICGESGSGKSTLAKVLMGIKKGYTGHLWIEDKERSELEDISFYEQFTYVSHIPFLIKGSLRDNLAMAKTKFIDDEAMLSTLKKVQLYDFFMQDKGLDTLILEGGANLSGGQKQRLAIGRALLKDSAVYVFDEATSNIDVESEEVIIELIKALAKTKTVILITHRLRAITQCDQIVMIEKGKIVECGTHKELIDLKAKYYQVYTKQVALEAYRGGEESV